MAVIRGTIDAQLSGTVSHVNVNRKVIIPWSWLWIQWHYGNLVVSKSVSKMLMSDRVSERVFGEMVIGFSGDFDPNNSGRWLVFDLDSYALEEVKFPDGTQRVSFDWDGGSFEIAKYLYVWDKEKKDWVRRASNASVEYVANDAMVKFFRPKFGIRLKSLVLGGYEQLDGIIGVEPPKPKRALPRYQG